jgi:hypothetical protein
MRTLTSILCPMATSKRHSEFGCRSWTALEAARVGAANVVYFAVSVWHAYLKVMYAYRRRSLPQTWNTWDRHAVLPVVCGRLMKVAAVEWNKALSFMAGASPQAAGVLFRVSALLVPALFTFWGRATRPPKSTIV